MDVSSTPITDQEKIDQGWVKIDETNFPDDKFRDFVLTGKSGSNDIFGQKIDYDNDEWLSPDEIAAVKVMFWCRYSGIENLKGIEYFTALEFLECDSNKLKALDVSKNTALTHLDCGGNDLTELDVSKNTALTHLDCGSNQLTELDVSKNEALTSLNCGYNPLEEVDVSKNTALSTLYCCGNRLEEVDVSKNTKLTNLDCSVNVLRKLDVSKNTELMWLNCKWNGLEELDLSKNTALINLECDSNHLISLDLGNTNVGDTITIDGYTIIGGLSADGNSNWIYFDVGSENRFDLQELPGFNVKNASNWIGGSVSVDGKTLTVDEGVDKVTYTYDCGTTKAGKQFSVKVTLNVMRYNEDPVDPDIPEDGGDTDDAADNIKGALSAVVVGAVASAIIYETGTGIYRVINMPGIAMPSNRGELAMLLWEHAGKPEPVSTALYSDITEDDIDLNKAARWAVEQGLMQDNSEKNTFNPRFPISKLRTCLTWNAAKEKGLLDTDKTAE